MNRYYTGDVCSTQNNSNAPIDAKQEVQEQTKEKPPECVGLGSGQTGCMKQNGDYCATSSTGKTFCWKPTETGKKTDANDAQVKSPKGDAVTPPDIKIPDKDWQRTDGHQQTACVNNTCMTYNVTNFSSVPGGTQKNSTADNNADGSGNTSGNGKPGTGSSDDGKDDDKDSASDSGNCTVAPMCTGDTLKCLHLKFTWKTQCNTTQNEISKGSTCDAGDVPVCAGNSCKAEQYAQLLQQWRTRCNGEALQKGVEGLAGTGDGDDGKGSILLQEKGDGPKLNEGLVAYGGGSGALGYDFEIEGQKFQMPQQILDFLPVLRMLIIAAATLLALSIIRGS
ncbi:A coat protein [Xanthomonas arboricola]|uniref:A coat protein n=1 Tax=Xanthomonas arboricola TaxID=56448 RepID=UPI001EE890E0|nr:A coat protein [Xanthomonas arboricola]